MKDKEERPKISLPLKGEHNKQTPSGSISMGSFGLTREVKGQTTNSRALSIIKKNGDKIAFWYYEIQSPIKFEANHKIEFNAGEMKVEITGRNLAELFDFIIEQRVVWIAEPSSSFTEKDDSSVWVERIVIDS